MLRIPILDLRKGMYVIDRGLRGLRYDSSVYSLEGFVLSDDEGVKLRGKGYTSAYVDEKRSPELEKLAAKAEPDSEYISPCPEFTDFKARVPEELLNACQAREKTLEYARELASLAAKGAQFTLETVHEVFNPTLISLERNPNALLCLSILQSKDSYTFSHGVDVAVFAAILARQLGVDPLYQRELSLAGFLHDIGKLFVPQKILNHPGRLNNAQFDSMRRHALLGYRYLTNQKDVTQFVLEGALDHHERYDGQGYPNGKAGTDISFAGRMLAVVDVYDALTSQRCYRKPLSTVQTMSQIYSTRSNDFAPGFVEAFISAMGVYPPGCLVMLDDKTFAVVVESMEDKVRPRIVVLTDDKGRPVTPRYLDLAAEGTHQIAQPVPRLPCKIDIIQAISRAE